MPDKHFTVDVLHQRVKVRWRHSGKSSSFWQQKCHISACRHFVFYCYCHILPLLLTVWLRNVQKWRIQLHDLQWSLFFFLFFLFVVFSLIQLMLMSVLNCLFESLSQIFRWVLPNLHELQNRYPAGPLWFHEEKPCFSQRGVCEMPRCTVDLFQTFQGVMRLVHMQIKRGVFLHMQLKLSAGSSWCCYYGNRCRSNAACEPQSQADYLRLKAFLHILNWL